MLLTPVLLWPFKGTMCGGAIFPGCRDWVDVHYFKYFYNKCQEHLEIRIISENKAISTKINAIQGSEQESKESKEGASKLSVCVSLPARPAWGATLLFIPGDPAT